MTHSSSPRTAVTTATIVGRGRVGRALSVALTAAGITVHGPTARGESIPAADVTLICVPDDAIAGVISAVARTSGWVGHVSGATTLDASGADFGLHPLQTFVGTEGPEIFEGIGCAIAGRSLDAVEVARELSLRIGARPFAIDDEHRASYHAAASIASNFVITLMAAVEQVAAAAGLAPTDARALFAPLVRSTVENWAVLGPQDALTGPIARGDEATVRRQRDAIGAHSPALLPLFDALADSTRGLAATGRSAA